MLKRLFDIVFSFIGIIILSPIFLFIICRIIFDSGFPVFFRQVRIRKGNNDFRIFKFRTMVKDADKKGLVTVGDRDPRVTRAGYFIRKYKLDEFPQLLNVLMGEMSIVGPAPEVRKYVDMYTPEQMKVLSIKPGMTDYASIEYSSENELLGKAAETDEVYINEVMTAKLKLGLKYVEERNLLTDIKIIALTILKIFF